MQCIIASVVRFCRGEGGCYGKRLLTKEGVAAEQGTAIVRKLLS